MTKVREMVLSMSMPIRAAVGASSATPRMLRPSLVPETSRSRKIIMITAAPIRISWMVCTWAPKTVNTVWVASK